ncbi:MAG TPA: transglycosylase domain-containing protein [Burkholderiaceae bacterium]|nr:transglycosylase domain-containing protein [Burkholderiaceae bacterium]
MRSILARAAAFSAERFRRTWQAVRRHPVRVLVFVPVAALAYVLALIPLTPGIGDIRKAKAEQPTVVLSADGKELAVFRRANREWVKLSAISPDVVAALIATEDHRFYEHHGIDVQRTFAAVVHTLRGSVQGGSTVTQQLARNFYPDAIGRAPTINRKLKEAITALKIEAVYSKEEILETYLNTVPFLYNAWGIEMAARTYFDKTADTLDLLESATLIGMLKGTRYYNPVLNPERAEQRRNIVLSQMVKRNQLEPAKFEVLKKMPLKVDFERQTEAIGPAPHLSRQLRSWLIEWADRNGYNIYADGLVVHTTIDSRLQAFANQAVSRQTDKLQATANAMWSPRTRWNANKDPVRIFVRELPAYKTAREGGLTDEQAQKQAQADSEAMQKLRADKTMLQAGFMALDPSNGHVKAWVGSRNFEQDEFDHVQQARRQPGSTFKPFVYGAAFEKGMKPSETLVDQVVEIQVDQGKVWRPSDGGAPSGLEMSLRDGLVYSKNTITAQLMERVGPASVANLARAMGVRQSKLDEVLSLGLGTSPVTLKEMVTAYGTLANGGSYIEPVLVTRVEDRHRKLLEEFAPKAREPAMSTAVAQTMVDVMRGVVNQGTGAGIRSRFGIQADVAGKTGTTQDNTDAWFILMHPQLVAGAWVGFNDNRVTMGSDWGQGARSALPIVGDFFQLTLKAKAIDVAMQFVTPPREPVPEMAAQPELVPGQPVAVETPAGVSETISAPGAPVRVEKVEKAVFGIPVFPPLEVRREPAQLVTGPATAPAGPPVVVAPQPIIIEAAPPAQ